MAKIDTSGIEGYADMTAEQKLAALEGMEIPEPDFSGYVKKSVFDKTAADLAAAKKSLGEHQTEEERQKAERDQEMETLRSQVASLQKEKTISVYKAKYLADGYDEKLAEDTAKALADGDIEKVFANQKAFIAAHDQSLKAQLLDSTPGMPGGRSEGKTDDITMAERLAERAKAAHTSVSEGMKHYL